jgi:predicted TIM-barrel fold metal-dependent hydrolase
LDRKISGRLAALTEVADSAHILYGSDWPYLDRKFVSDQLSSLVSLPQFAGRLIEPLEWRNAERLFKRFTKTLAQSP